MMTPTNSETVMVSSGPASPTPQLVYPITLRTPNPATVTSSPDSCLLHTTQDKPITSSYDNAPLFTQQEKDDTSSCTANNNHDTNTSITTSNTNGRDKLIKTGIAVALIVCTHLFCGIQPVLGRYLQTKSKVPSFSINAMSNGLLVILLTPIAIARYVLAKIRQRRKLNALKNRGTNLADQDPEENTMTIIENEQATVPNKIKLTWKDYLRMVLATGVVLTGFTVFRLGRSIGNLFSSKLTTSLNVQLLYLTGPFMVSGIMLLGALVKKATGKARTIAWPLDWRMLVAMLVTIAGGSLVVLGTSSTNSDNSFSWKIEWQKLIQPKQDSSSLLNMLGILICIGANVMGACYTTLVPYVTTSDSDEKPEMFSFEYYNKFKTDGFNVNYLQTILVALYCTALSFITGEKWSRWLELGAYDWIIFIIYAVFVVLLAEVFFVIAVKILGSLTCSSLMAVSLIGTISCSWLVLGEIISNLWQIVGSLIVIVGVTLFMIFKGKLSSKANNKDQQLSSATDIEPEEMTVDLEMSREISTKTIVENIELKDGNESSSPTQEQRLRDQELQGLAREKGRVAF